MDVYHSARMSRELLDSDRKSILGTLRWHKAPGFGDLDLAEPLPRMFVVKHGQHRTVYRVDFSRSQFFLKHQRCRSLRDLLRNLIRPNGSRREYDKSLALARREIPTIHAVAWGERREFGVIREHGLLTKAIPHSCSLLEYAEDKDHWVPKAARAAFDRQLCVELAKLCAKAHRAGVWHDDLHPGNILLRFEDRDIPADDADRSVARFPTLYLIDVPGVRLTRRSTWRRSRASLVMLLTAVARLSTKTQQWRFWRQYLTVRDDLSTIDPREVAADIDRRSRRWLRSLVRGRDKRFMATNRDYYRLSVAGGRGHAVRDLDPDCLKKLIAAPHRLIERNIELPLKISHSSVVVEADIPIAGMARHVLYKRISVTNVTKWLTSFARQSRAEQGWRLGHALRARGIPTARPLAVIIPRRQFRSPVSYLVTEWIHGARDFHQFAWKLARLSTHERFVIARNVARSLGKLVGHMHEACVTHRDLKGCNILITQDGRDVRCYLIDMHGVDIRRALSRTRRVRNLARLALSAETHPWITRTMRLRFLRSYCQAKGTPDEWKTLWPQIATRTRQLICRNQKRGKPIA